MHVHTSCCHLRITQLSTVKLVKFLLALALLLMFLELSCMLSCCDWLLTHNRPKGFLATLDGTPWTVPTEGTIHIDFVAERYAHACHTYNYLCLVIVNEEWHPMLLARKYVSLAALACKRR
jgi:hypothetical protein